MPQFDGSYPNLGVEYHPTGWSAQVLPQVECIFANLGYSGQIEGNATPAVSTESRGLDPQPFIDMYLDIVDGVPVYSNGTFAHPQDTTHPSMFTFGEMKVRSGGSGLEVQAIPGLGSWYVKLKIIDSSGDGYFAKVSEAGALILGLLTSHVETILKSVSVPVASEAVMSLLWDGNSKFKASWGSYYVSDIDDTHSVSDSNLIVEFKNSSIRYFLGGVSEGVLGFEPTAAFRDAMCSNILLYDGVEFPWPSLGTEVVPESSDVFLSAAVTKVTSSYSTPFITLAYAPAEYISDAATPSPAPDLDIIGAWLELLTDYPNVNDFIVWKDNFGMECGSDENSTYYDATPGCTLGEWDLRRYQILFSLASYWFKDTKSTVRLYGPNNHLAARGEGFDTSYSGVLIDSRDMDFLEEFIAAADAATPMYPLDGVAVSGDFTNSEWELLIPYLKSLIGSRPLVITANPPAATPSQASVDAYVQVMNDTLDAGDTVFTDYSGVYFESPRLKFTQNDWSFNATMTVPYTMQDAKLKVVDITETILLNGGLVIQNDNATPFYLADELPSRNGTVLLGDLPQGTYSISIFGDKGITGTAMLRLGIYSDNFDVLTISDTKFLEGP